jgi:hypothetical protein
MYLLEPKEGGGGMSVGLFYCARIFKQSMRVSNRVGIGLSYQPAGLHSLAKLVPWNSWSPSMLKKFGLCLILSEPSFKNG